MKRKRILLQKNKKGWIEIVEAFFAVLLVAGVVIVLYSKGYFGKGDIDNKVYTTQVSILREIQTDEGLRREVCGVAGSMPVSWDDANFPEEVKNKIIERTPSYLVCLAKICDQNSDCILDEEEIPEGKKNIYSEFVMIHPTIGCANVIRKLNLFCWQG